MSTAADGRELGPVLEAHRFDEAALADYLKTRLPDCDGKLVVRQFLGGQSNPTFQIEMGGGTYVLRKKPPGKLLPSAHAVDREYKVITALHDTDVPVPKTYLLCEDDSVIGQMFYVMDYVPGRIITEREMPGCSPVDRRAIFLDMAKVFGALHSVDIDAVGLSDFGRPTGYVARQVARWSKQYDASRVEECPAMDNLIAWLPQNDPDDDQTSIVHGDFRMGNLVFDANEPRVVGVLDWELSTLGHPLADLGYYCFPYHIRHDQSAYGLIGLDTEAMGIPPEEEVLKAYCERTGRSDIPNFEYYVVFSMFRLAAIQAGVLKRGLDGNAADPRAIERGRAYTQMAESAWEIASHMG